MMRFSPVLSSEELNGGNCFNAVTHALIMNASMVSLKRGFKLTMLAFMIKACVTALKQFPPFNSSLDKTGENLIIKHYYHIGVAVDTPGGLVVPVVRDADRKGVFDLAHELADISKVARDGKLKPA